jgi:hypothetical protein
MSIAQNFPTISPSLNLSFALTKALDPRITYTRASTATYYGTRTAKAEENLLLRSQDYSATWTVTSLTPVTAKTAPDGTSTATEFTASAANAVLTQGYTAIAGSYTFSVYLRRVTGTGDIQIAADNGTWNTKVITASWARYDITQTVAAGAKTAGIRVVNSSDAIEVWGAQLEQRSAVTAYTVTTTQPITNYIPVLESAASGVARFDHNPTTFESLGFLIEESRSNLLTYSSEFDNAAWTKTASTISANTIVAPDGSLTGDKIVVDSGGSVSTSAASVTSYQAVSKAATATTYSFSYYAKAGEFNAARLFVRDTASGANNANVTVSLVDGSILVAAAAAGTFTAASASAGTVVGNGWYRFTLTFTSGTETGLRILVVPSNSSATTGNGYSGIFIWGAQLEAGAFATSYIPTVASQVTRAADAASMTGTNFSSWYNAGEGTLYLEAIPTNISSTAQTAFAITNIAATTNLVGTAIGQNAGGSGGQSTSFWVREDGANQALLFTANNVLNIGVLYKVAGAYQFNNFAQSTNSATPLTDTSGIVPKNMDRMLIGKFLSSSEFSTHIKKFAYYPLRLTNAQLQAITG